MFEAFRYIAERRGTTVLELLGTAVIDVTEARELPKRMQQRLRNLDAERPPIGRPRAAPPRPIKPK